MDEKTKAQIIIGKLPEWMQPYAAEYARLLVDVSFEQIEAMVLAAAQGDFGEAYGGVMQTLTTEQVIAELERVCEQLRTATDKQVNFVNAQRQVILNLLMFGLAMAKAELTP